MTIRWKPSREGYVDSHCGRWSIEPLFFSCVKPQSFKLWRDGKTVAHSCNTQKEAKQLALSLLMEEQAAASKKP